MSMEKSSKILMTAEDMSLFRSGEVSSRLKNLYNILSYDELYHIIAFMQYEEIE